MVIGFLLSSCRKDSTYTYHSKKCETPEWDCNMDCISGESEQSIAYFEQNCIKEFLKKEGVVLKDVQVEFIKVDYQNLKCGNFSGKTIRVFASPLSLPILKKYGFK